MNKAEQQINAFFKKHKAFFDQDAPRIIARTATEYYKQRFREKSWDGKPWPALSKNYKPKRGSMMVRTSKLMNSIQESTVTPGKVVISAGNSKVPYARIHNEGGVIKRAARSEVFNRNRNKKGRFRKGTKAGKGFTFRAGTINMPKRQYMGFTQELNERVIKRFKELYKFK